MGYSLWVLRFGSEMFPQSLCLRLGPQMIELWEGCGSCKRPGIVRNVFSNSGSYPQVCPHPFSLLPTAMSWATVLPPSFRHYVSSLPRRPESNETSQPWTELSEAVKQDEAFPPCSHLSRSLCHSNRKLKPRAFAVLGWLGPAAWLSPGLMPMQVDSSRGHRWQSLSLMKYPKGHLCKLAIEPHLFTFYCSDELSVKCT